MAVANLTRRDAKVMAGIAGVWVGAALVSHVGSFYQVYGPQLEMVMDVTIFGAGVAAAYYIYRSVTAFGGVVGRGLAMIGIGVGYASLTAVMHVYFHLNRPEFLPYFTFQHTAQAWSALLIAYGFYLLYRGGTV